MKKYKQFIVGFILGALIFAILPVSAEIQEYILYKSDCSLVINGTDWQDSDLPMLNYKGYNYIPAAAFKAISEQIGASFNFNNITKQIQINTTLLDVTVPQEESLPVLETTQTEIPEMPSYDGLKEGMDWVWYEYEDYAGWCIQYNGDIYMNAFYAERTLGYREVTRTTGTFREGTHKQNHYLILDNKEIIWDRSNESQTLNIANKGLYINFTWLIDNLVN